MANTMPTSNIVGESAASSSSTSMNDPDTINIEPTNDADDLEGLCMIIDNYKCSLILLVLPGSRGSLLSASRSIIGFNKREEGQLKS